MTESPPGRIFISYRRQETAWPARQLYDVMVERFGAEQVFKDVDNIEPGDDFVERITSAVGSCDVLLALIGPRWLTITEDESGQRRLDNPDDYVRLEIQTALDRHIRVIPILIDDARMPRPNELPPDLAPLVRRHAVEISPITFDTKRLMTTVQDTLAELHPAPADEPPPIVVTPKPELEPLPEPEQPSPRSPWRARIIVGAAAAALLAAAVVLVIVNLGPADDPTITTNDAPSTNTSPSLTPTPSATPTTPTTDYGPAVLARRGGSEEYPSETLKAFTSAAGAGYAVETDVRWTSDGTAVLVHDESTEPLLDCTRPYNVPETTWSDLEANCQSLPGPDGPEPIPRYTDAMRALATIPDAWVYLEIKTDQTEEQTRQVLEAISYYGMTDRTVLTSFERKWLEAIGAVSDLPRMLLLEKDEQIPAAELGKDGDKLWGVAVQKDTVTKEYVQELKAAGLTVLVWVVNEVADWEKARDVGVDKVLTDYPEKYSTWRDEQSQT